MNEFILSLLKQALIEKNVNINFIKENSDILCVSDSFEECIVQLNKRFSMLDFNIKHNNNQPVRKFKMVDTREIDRLLDRIMLVYGEEVFFNCLSEDKQMVVRMMI